MQIFNFGDGHVTTFPHYICQMPGHRLSKLAQGTPTVSAFHRYHWFGVKLFLVQAVRRIVEGYPKNAKYAVFGSGSAHALLFLQKNTQSFWFGLEPPTRRSRSKSAQKVIVFRTILYSVQQMCAKFYGDRLRFGSTRVKILFWSKNRERPSIGLAVNNGTVLCL